MTADTTTLALFREARKRIDCYGHCPGHTGEPCTCGARDLLARIDAHLRASEGAGVEPKTIGELFAAMDPRSAGFAARLLRHFAGTQESNAAAMRREDHRDGADLGAAREYAHGANLLRGIASDFAQVAKGAGVTR
jgi:hypothetical protein